MPGGPDADRRGLPPSRTHFGTFDRPSSPPTSPQALTAITQFVADYDIILAVVSVGIVAVLVLGVRFGFRVDRRRRIAQAIPVVGPMIQSVALAEFCQLAAILVDARVPLPRSPGTSGMRASATPRWRTRRATSRAWWHRANRWPRRSGSGPTCPPRWGRSWPGASSATTSRGSLRFAGEMFRGPRRGSEQAGESGPGRFPPDPGLLDALLRPRRALSPLANRPASFLIDPTSSPNRAADRSSMERIAGR